ncbi:14847_t:CDS:1, partial [Funneliformis geosporum]
VRASNACIAHQSVRAKVAFENQGTFEWDIIIDKYCQHTWIGVCASENFDYEKFAGIQNTGWVLSSTGFIGSKDYCPSFATDNSKVTIHLYMNKKICAFTINGVKYSAVSEWNNLTSKLYPVVSLVYPDQFRIQFH